MGREEREDIHEVIAKAVSVAVKAEMKKERWTTLGMYIILVGIFLSIAWPMNDKLYNHENKLAKYESQLENKADNSFVMEKFLSKEFYAFLEEEQNKATLSALKDHTQANNIYQTQNIQNAKQLDIRWRSAREIN